MRRDFLERKLTSIWLEDLHVFDEQRYQRLRLVLRSGICKNTMQQNRRPNHVTLAVRSLLRAPDQSLLYTPVGKKKIFRLDSQLLDYEEHTCA